MEIGFNAGHSSELFLKTNPRVEVTSFDIMEHDYASTGKKYIDQHYPGRHTLIKGDSTKTIKNFAKRPNHQKFDFIFIDGCHEYKVAFEDILNMRKLTHKDTLVIVDDLQYAKVYKAWIRALRSNILKQVEVVNTGDHSWGIAVYR